MSGEVKIVAMPLSFTMSLVVGGQIIINCAQDTKFEVIHTCLMHCWRHVRTSQLQRREELLWSAVIVLAKP